MGNGQKLGSGGTEGSVETCHGSRKPSFPCACKTRIGIMSFGLKKGNDCLPFIKAFFDVFVHERIVRSFSILRSDSTSTAFIVHTCKIAYFIMVDSLK